MTDGGDDGEFQVHPGDPWHPGWTDDAPQQQSEASSSEVTPKKKRRLFGRKHHDDAVEVEWPGDDAPLPEPREGDVRFRPPDPFPAEPVTTEIPVPTVRAPVEAPMPAWLSDPPQPERDPSLKVELPSWVGNTSAGAEVVAAGFEETVSADAEAIPAGDDLAAALHALESIDDSDIEVAVTRAAEGDEDDEPTLGLEALEALRALEADQRPIAGTYGVAGKEAFEALRTGDTDDISDWRAFTGDSPAPAEPAPTRAAVPPVIADPAALDEWATTDAEPREKRGVWPFRRRKREEEEVAEEGAEWLADDKPIPKTWFPEVDEDVVVPPGAELPEVEWPTAPQDSDTAFQPPAAAIDPDRTIEITPPRSFTPRTDPEPLSSIEPEAPRWADPPPAVAPIDVPRRLVSPAEDLFDGNADDLQAGGPWRLDFDDGTAEVPYGATEYDPAPAAAVRGDRDEWDLPDDATEEMSDPGIHLGEEIYSGSVTVEHRGLAEEMFRLGAEDTEWQAMSAAMPGVETGVVGFEDVADLTTGEEYRERPRSDLGVRVGTGLLLLVFLLGTMFVGGGAMAVFIGAMALLGIWEFYGTLRRLEFRPLTLLGYLAGTGLLAGVWFHGPIAVPIAIAVSVILTYFVYAFSPMREDALANGGLTILGLAWVAGTIAFAFPMLRQADFRVLVMAVVVTTVAMDVGAYAFGRTWGKRALSPVLSPNKSIEGLIGGILLAGGAAVGFGMLAEPFDIGSGIALGVVVSVMAPLGDLAESMVKRSLGVKDMGTVLPGHGGVLDRIDAFLFVIPASWVLYQVLGFLP